MTIVAVLYLHESLIIEEGLSFWNKHLLGSQKISKEVK